MVAAIPAREPQHELDRCPRRDVLEDDAQARNACRERRQHLIDEPRFAIEHVDVGVGDFAMHLKDEIPLLHAREHGMHAADVCHAGIGVSRRPGRIELEADDAAARLCPVHLRRIRPVGEVERHQRLECHAGWAMHPGFADGMPTPAPW